MSVAREIIGIRRKQGLNNNLLSFGFQQAESKKVEWKEKEREKIKKWTRQEEMEWKGYKERWKVENGKKGEEKMEMEMGNNTTHIISSHHSLMVCMCVMHYLTPRVSNLARGH